MSGRRKGKHRTITLAILMLSPHVIHYDGALLLSVLQARNEIVVLGMMISWLQEDLNDPHTIHDLAN